MRLLLLFASGGRARPASLLGGVSTILRTASRFFIRSLCAFCRSHTGSDGKTPRTHREKAAARRAANKILRREIGASVFGLFTAYPMARIANAEKMCYNLS